jgi:putative methylase
MQKRLVRRLELERLLSQVEAHPSPRPDLEQYTIPSDIAASILHLAAYVRDDIVGKRVMDLGCGTGRLAIGAAFLGAKETVGVDIDRVAVRKAFDNSRKTCLEDRVQWVVADIDAIRGEFDTVLQNPPFGVQRRGADREFLETALRVGKVIYSLHKRPSLGMATRGRSRPCKTGCASVAPSPFLVRFIEEHGGRIVAVYAMVMSVPRMFAFHTRRKHKFVVDLYVVERSAGD